MTARGLRLGTGKFRLDRGKVDMTTVLERAVEQIDFICIETGRHRHGRGTTHIADGYPQT